MMPYSSKNDLRKVSSMVGGSPPTKIFLVLSFESAIGGGGGGFTCPAPAGVVLLPPKMLDGGEMVEKEGEWESLEGGDSSLGKALLASTSLLSIVCWTLVTLSAMMGSVKTTKPKPRGFPVWRSYDTNASWKRGRRWGW